MKRMLLVWGFWLVACSHSPENHFATRQLTELAQAYGRNISPKVR